MANFPDRVGRMTFVRESEKAGFGVYVCTCGVEEDRKRIQMVKAKSMGRDSSCAKCRKADGRRRVMPEYAARFKGNVSEDAWKRRMEERANERAKD